MTRQDFIDGVTEWYELLDFCYNEECDICEDIVSYDGMCEEVDEELAEAVREHSWREVRDMLNDIETNYDYYRRGGLLSYCPVNDNSDFEDYKSDVIEWMDNGGYWEDEEDEDDFDDDVPFLDDDFAPGEEDENEEEPTVEDEDFSVGELMGMCSVQYLGIQREAAQHMKQNDKEFEQYLSSMPKVLQ